MAERYPVHEVGVHEEDDVGSQLVPSPQLASAMSEAKVLLPGSQIFKENESCLYGGTLFVGDMRYGITVGHPFIQKVLKDFHVECKNSLFKVLGGRCIESFYYFTYPDNRPITADLSFLKLNPTIPAENTIQCFDNGRYQKYQLKLNKAPLKNGMSVTILNQDGEHMYGVIRNPKCSCDPYFQNCFSVVNNVKDCKRITRLGDSGSLVTSRPIPNSNVLVVYGMVIGIWGPCDCKSSNDCVCPRTTMTIASDLRMVLEFIISSPAISCQLFPGIEPAKLKMIDFTPDAATPSNIDSGRGTIVRVG